MAADPSVADAIALLADAFPRWNLTARTVDVYLDDLADLPADVVVAAITDLRREAGRVWAPSIGEVREAALTRMLALPDEAEAWRQAEAYAFARPARVSCPSCDDGVTADPETCRTCGGDGTVFESLLPVHRLVKEALELVGGRTGVREADEMSVVRGQFGRFYRIVRERELREANQRARTLSASQQTAIGTGDRG